MFVTRLDFILAFVTVFSNFERIKCDEVESGSKNQDVPSSVDSRFFGLGGFINQLFPGFNQGNQPRPGRNPGGIDFPGNSQFYPGRPIQNTPPQQYFNNQQNQSPMIDDAKYYPNQGYFGNIQPGNYGNYPNQANVGSFPQWQGPLGNGNGFGSSQGGFPNQYPNQHEYPSLGGYPQNVNQPEFGGIQGNPYPNQGISGYQPTPYPTQGSFGYPFTPSPNEGNYVSSPSIPYPEQSNNGMITPIPYPSNWGTSKSPDYPTQGEFNGDNSFRPGVIGDESIGGPTESETHWDIDVRNPTEPSSNETTTTTTTPQSQRPIEESSSEKGINAILGKPVIIPETTTPEGQIVFPESTENAEQKQCVQDCQSPTEYNPVCGTDDITYINPGKFVCARNCGVHVFVKHIGRCSS
ncbi:rac guanine nucleotide exchange factor JJ-like [Hyposmocoma kahamanoa]|uniref:rac guanine nucleotide exchange factor JJ-like n=1 Tax=Hyposmocoma kahamanoa TaxID=1477025 RepID=UPI000E6D8489|nr:rac guanine nucleotide exchange factor JJ-like [Hyposmocoma kahamanoa]